MTPTPTAELMLPRGMTIRMPLPTGWALTQPGVGNIVAVLAAPVPAGRFTPNVVVTAEPLPEGTGLREWQRGVDLLLPRSLHDYVLLDLEHVELAGRRAVRRLAHHVTEHGDAVVLEQWAAPFDGPAGPVGLTVSATTPALAPALGAALGDVAGGVRVVTT